MDIINLHLFMLSEIIMEPSLLKHDDVIKWKHFPRYWPFVRGIHRSPRNSPHKGQCRGALTFCVICAWIKGWFETPSRPLWRLRNEDSFWNWGLFIHFDIYLKTSGSDFLTLCCRCWFQNEQSKSEGFDSCDRPSNLAQIWSESSIFQPVWPRKITGHLFYTTSSFVYHFKSIGEFKLKLQSGNAQFGSKSQIFCPVWPWNLMDELGKQ